MPKKRNMHPNSLANIIDTRQSHFNEENARDYQKKSVETRLANKERRERLQQIVDDFKALKIDMPPAVDVLRVQLAEAMAGGDNDEISRLASLLAPYETPKLASKDVNITDGLKDKTDEELSALAKEFGIKLEDLH